MSKPRNNLFELMVEGQKLGAFDDRWHGRLARLWNRGIQDEFLASSLAKRVQSYRVKAALGQLIPFRPPRLTRKGRGIVFGCDIHGRTVFIPVEFLRAHLLAPGNTGAGKSNLIAFVIPQIAALGCAVWLVDLYKTQNRRLRPIFHQHGRELVILRPIDFRINPLQAWDNDPRDHLSLTVGRLVRILDLPPRASMILGQICHELYREFGIWDGQKDRWPTLFHVYERVRNQPGLNAPAREAILDRLGSLLIRLTPAVAAHYSGWNPVELAKRSIDFEMTGAPIEVRQFLVEHCIDFVFQREVERGVVNGPLDLFIAFDDAQRFFNSEAGQMNGMDEKIGVTRGCGKSIGVFCQTLHGLSQHLMPNLATKMHGRLGTHDDWAAMGRHLGLNSEQVQWSKQNLSPGRFVGALAEGSWHEPFVFDVPLVDLSQPVTDADAAASRAGLNKLPVTPADEYRNWSPYQELEAPSAQTATSAQPKLSDPELRFLKSIAENVGEASGFHAKAAGVNGKKARQIRERLVRDGFVAEHKIQIGGRRPSVVLELLPAGKAALGASQGGGI